MGDDLCGKEKPPPLNHPKWKDAATEPPKNHCPRRRRTNRSPEHEITRDMLDRLSTARDHFPPEPGIAGGFCPRRETETREKKAEPQRGSWKENRQGNSPRWLMDAAKRHRIGGKD